MPLLADLFGLQDCDGSHHGGNQVQAALAAGVAAAAAAAVKGEDDGRSPKGGPAAKRLRIQLPSGMAAAVTVAAAVASVDPQQQAAAAAAATGTGRMSRTGSLAAVPALSSSRLERELEKALRAFIRIK